MTTPEPLPDEGPFAAEVRAAVGRLTASQAFGKSHQLSQFLTFIVAETLAGRGERIKAYTIATDALKRDACFDPQADPIVRVEAGRLRRALERYYKTEGRDDPICIELPRGGYVPRFSIRRAPQGALARVSSWRRALVDSARENSRLLLLVVAVAATVSVSFDLLWMTLSRVLGSAAQTVQQALPQAKSANGPTDRRMP